MSNSNFVRLTRLVLWYDATRVHAWPEIITSVTDEDRDPTPVDFGRRRVTDRMTDSRHAASEMIVRNLPGLERQVDGGVILRGLGLLQRYEDGYGLSQYGKTLRDQYRAKDRRWISTLATVMVDREPRTRCLLKAIGESQHGIELFNESASMRWSRSILRSKTGILKPFSSSAVDLEIFRVFVDHHAFWALGAWREDPLLDGCTIEGLAGSRSKTWSTEGLGLAFRSAIEVFLATGCLVEIDGCIQIEHQTALAVFGQDRCFELGWEAKIKKEIQPDIVQTLHQCCLDLASPTGHIVASELIAALIANRITDPEQAIAALEANGSIAIHDTDYGQSRHGRGLYGDPRRQLLKIRFLNPKGLP